MYAIIINGFNFSTSKNQIGYYSNLNGGLQRRFTMAQLHVYADGFDTVPTEIANNISSQIQPPDRIPKGLDEYSEQEIKDFPKLWDYPKDYRPV